MSAQKTDADKQKDIMELNEDLLSALRHLSDNLATSSFSVRTGTAEELGFPTFHINLGSLNREEPSSSVPHPITTFLPQMVSDILRSLPMLQESIPQSYAQMFLPNEIESESEMLEKRMILWAKDSPSLIVPGKFLRALSNDLKLFLTRHSNSMTRIPEKQERYTNILETNPVITTNMDSLWKLQESSDSKQLAECVSDILTEVFKQARSYRTQGNHNTSTTCKILDLSSVDDKRLRFLSELFLDSQDAYDRALCLQQLMKYVPTVMIQTRKLPTAETYHICANCNQTRVTETCHTCFDCGMRICFYCPVEKTKVPRLNRMHRITMCSKCLKAHQEYEREQWMEKALELLTGETEENAQAALACVVMSLYASVYSKGYTLRQINKIAKVLIQEDLPEFALQLLSVITHQSYENVECVRAHVLASKAIENMAYDPSIMLQEHIELLRAAKAECEEVYKLQSREVEVPNMSARITELGKTLNNLETEDKYQHDRLIKAAVNKLQRAWDTRNWDQLIKMVVEKPNDHIINPYQINPTMEALKQVLRIHSAESDSQSKMMLEMLSGFVCIFKGEFSEGLVNIENAVWRQTCNSDLFHKTAVDMVISIMINDYKCVHPLHAVHIVCKEIADGESSDLSKLLPTLHLTEGDLIPPFPLQWPQTHFFSSSIIKRYEENVVKSASQGKWATKEVAKGYLDMVKHCQSADQVALCYINTSLWLLKSLKEKAGIQSTLPSEIYTTKIAILHFLTQAFIIANSCLHPGMQLYIARIALGASLVAVELSGTQATKSDSERILQFLTEFIRKAPFCPFIHAPVVTVFEACMLTNIVREQHTAFISALQHVPREYCHLQPLELLYQLYENDIKGLQKLENSENMKYKVMDELLKERNIEWEDISNIMKSCICPRTSEGWISVNRPVPMSLEYAQIKGIRLNCGTYHLPNPSLELLVAQSDGTNGLISQLDADAFLTLHSENINPLYFSLDPPSIKERYHPFQQLRFHPEGIRNTEVLQTLLEADYLMKFFSIGSEVSANPPFKQRRCTEGLLSGLPTHLKEALKPVYERGELKGSMFRFWIEATEMKYDIEDKDNTVIVKCGEPEMIIRNHRIYLDPNGELKDTEDESSPNSPQALFAADLTKHYDEIGKYFPAFARIKELCKLQLLANYIKNSVIAMRTNVGTNQRFRYLVTDVETGARTNIAANSKDRIHQLPCLWVPASLCNENMLMAYGGVNLMPRYVKSPLPSVHNACRVTLSSRTHSTLPTSRFKSEIQQGSKVVISHASEAPPSKMSGHYSPPSSKANLPITFSHQTLPVTKSFVSKSTKGLPTTGTLSEKFDWVLPVVAKCLNTAAECSTVNQRQGNTNRSLQKRGRTGGTWLIGASSSSSGGGSGTSSSGSGGGSGTSSSGSGGGSGTSNSGSGGGSGTSSGGSYGGSRTYSGYSCGGVRASTSGSSGRIRPRASTSGSGGGVRASTSGSGAGIRSSSSSSGKGIRASTSSSDGGIRSSNSSSGADIRTSSSNNSGGTRANTTSGGRGIRSIGSSIARLFRASSSGSGIRPSTSGTGEGTRASTSGSGEGTRASTSGSGGGVRASSSGTGEGTRASTSGTGEGTRASTSGSGGGVRASSSGTGEGTRASTSGTGEGTRASTSGTGEGTRASTSGSGGGVRASSSGTGEGTRASTSSTGEGTRASNSSTGEGTRASTSGSGGGVRASSSGSGGEIESSSGIPWSWVSNGSEMSDSGYPAADSQTTGGASSASGGSNGDDSNGDSSGGNPWAFIHGPLVVAGLCAVIKTKEIRSKSKQQKLRKQKGCTDRKKHAAHKFSLGVFTAVFNTGIAKGAFELPQPFNEFIALLKEILNDTDNLEIVPARVNQSDHKIYDNGLLTNDPERIQRDVSRGNGIVAFFESKLAQRLETDIALYILGFLYSRGLMTKERRNQIKQSIIVSIKQSQSVRCASKITPQI